MAGSTYANVVGVSRETVPVLTMMAWWDIYLVADHSGVMFCKFSVRREIMSIDDVDIHSLFDPFCRPY